MIALIVKIVLAYLLGSVSGSLLLGRLKKIDIRGQGSGNAGGTNAFRTQGLVFALGVVVIDVGKGFIAAWLIPALDIGAAPGLLERDLLVMLCGLAAVIGHCYPVWHGFRGGKGAAAAVGAIIVIEPWLLLPLVITWLVTLIMTGYVGLSTVLAGFSLVPASWAMNDNGLMIFSAVLGLFLLFTHRENMRRLRDGEEYRFERIYLFSRKR
ncbi:MAG: glycerol-3-phosphate 1-O-acyltransferase PlsY [Xanthomonadales bacterium]|nr:glycerol-3-phosphate 1-O-acyltransferase PlsY [Gammaproteobacteria bacterium]NNK04536.1 glycerol-3-phosphate 1-O-acyltransferase PlsY [Xanthomonadales bacterium]NNL00028.1 glycerol-3-phosphate 1-O-acyltransferase PlsY [Xanthomonadales bacterium]